jgi:chemotaxis protein MotB
MGHLRRKCAGHARTRSPCAGGAVIQALLRWHGPEASMSNLQPRALGEPSARSLLTGSGMKKTTTGFGFTCLLLAVGCVSTGKYQRKEEELAQLRSDSTERDRAAEADRRRLQAAIDKLTGEISALSRKLATVSYERDALFEARNGDLALVNQLKKRLEALGQNVEALTREKGALAASMTDAYSRLQELNRQRVAAEQRAVTFQSLVEKLQEMISTGQLEVVIRQGRMLIVMPNDVLFDSGRTQVKAQGRVALTAVARALATVKDRRFTVVGHTDDVPIHNARFRQNWDLSTARAVEVSLFLIEAGLKPEVLGAAGHGEYDPVVANDSEQNRSKNRRVEIELEPNITELPSFSTTAVAVRP